MSDATLASGPRLCNGGPNGRAWCGVTATHVGRDESGLEWFCCGDHAEGAGTRPQTRLMPLDEWMVQEAPCKGQAAVVAGDLRDPVSLGELVTTVVEDLSDVDVSETTVAPTLGLGSQGGVPRSWDDIKKSLKVFLTEARRAPVAGQIDTYTRQVEDKLHGKVGGAELSPFMQKLASAVLQIGRSALGLPPTERYVGHALDALNRVEAAGEEGPVVCPGCYAVGAEVHSADCIDARIEARIQGHPEGMGWDEDEPMDEACEHAKDPTTCVWCATGEEPEDYP